MKTKRRILKLWPWCSPHPYKMTKDARVYCLRIGKYICEDVKERERVGNPIYIRDPLYGLMKFTWDELVLINTCYVQRLRRISQLSFIHLLFPCARHTRFEHSLGVAHITKKILSVLKERNDLSQVSRDLKLPELILEKSLIYSAILHDIGHGPLSHTSEDAAEMINEIWHLETKSPKKKPSAKSRTHEAISYTLIAEDKHNSLLLRRKEVKTCTCLYHVLRYLFKQIANDRHISLTNDEICFVINLTASYILNPKDPTIPIKRRPLHMIINGSIDADKLDYLLRDAYYAGLKVSQAFDIDRVVHGFAVDRKKLQLVLFDKAVLEALSLLQSRILEESSVWSHHVAIITSAMMRKAIQSYMESYDYALRYKTLPKNAIKFFIKEEKDKILSMDDCQFLEFISRKVVQRKIKKKHLRRLGVKKEKIKKIAGRLDIRSDMWKLALQLKNRNLYKRLAIYLLSEGELPSKILGEGKKLKYAWIKNIERKIANKAGVSKDDVIVVEKKPYASMPDADDVYVFSVKHGSLQFYDFLRENTGLTLKQIREKRHLMVCVPSNYLRNMVLEATRRVVAKELFKNYTEAKKQEVYSRLF